MPRRVYRVCREVYANLDGEGARLVGGRWNSPGRSVVYMAETVSLAVLENLVHLAREQFPVGYVVRAAVIPDEIALLTNRDLEAHIGAGDPVELGDRWIDSGLSAVLRVRSTVVPPEHNYLLNPRHPDFAKIRVEPVVPFIFDKRLFVTRRGG